MRNIARRGKQSGLGRGYAPSKEPKNAPPSSTIKDQLLSDTDKLRSPLGYLNAGYPNFNTLFGRDALIAGWQMLHIDSSLARAALHHLAYYQATTFSDGTDRQPGKILHVLESNTMPGREMPYFGSVDATPLFVIVAGEYFRVTQDKAFLLRIWPNVIAAINWILVVGDADHDHFIEYERKTPHGDFHQGWKDCREDHLKITPPVAIVEAQGYVYAAYRSAANLAEQLGRDAANLWLDKAQELKEAFHKPFWWETESYYYIGLDGSKIPRESVSSNPGHLFFTGIIPEHVLPKIIQRIFQPDLFTPYGIRTLSERDPDFDSFSYHLGSVWPHDNWIIYNGLRKLGFTEEADRIKQALLLAYREMGYMPELYRVEDGEIFPLTEGPEYVHHPGPNTGYANRLQAWAICGLLDMIWED